MAIKAHREKSIFNIARQILTPEAREEYLDQVCEGDSQLRQRILILLSAHQEQDRFLEIPMVETSNDLEDTFPHIKQQLPGDEIGPYQLIQCISEGGMGSVWMAEQHQPVRRRVALKLIKPGMDSQQVLLRFEAERQALSLMDHPNIAKVLDAGTSDFGQSYFVMELVNGRSITDYCDEKQLNTHHRLQLFLQVCQAVQHAHQKGIIHRDIKPSNVLVAEYDGRAVAKLIDFGVAKALHQPLTAKSMFTGLGQLIGTLEYMSPEQARGNQLDIDTRSDIYSLGVLLYELLTGSPPFDRRGLGDAALDELLRIIREQEPPRPSEKLSNSPMRQRMAEFRGTQPSRLTTLIRGDLDWIVMKALEKDRDRRYETVTGLLNDVQCFLNNQTVTAVPPTIGYRLRKYMRRYRLQMVAASLIAMTLLAAIVGTSWGLIEARQQARLARAELQEKEKARETALAERKLAVEFRNRALEALRATTSSDIELLLAERQTLGPNERNYLEAIASRWQAFSQLEGEDELTRAVRGEGHYRLGSLLLRLGREETAAEEYQQAVTIYKALVAEFPSIVDYQVELATCHINLGSLLHGVGKPLQAESHMRTGLAMLQALAKTFPDDARNRDKLANCHTNLALLLAEAGQSLESEQHYQDGLEILTKLVKDLSEPTAYLRELARCQNNYGLLMAQLGRVSEAEGLYRQALTNYERLVQATPASPILRNELAWSNRNMGILLRSTGSPQSAIDHYVAAIAILESMAKEFPAVPEYQIDLAASLDGLAVAMADVGETQEAQSRYEQSLSILLRLVGEFPEKPEIRFQLSQNRNNLGVLFFLTGENEKAESLYRLASDELKKLTEDLAVIPKYLQELARSCNNLGLLFTKVQNFVEADSWYLEAVKIQQRLASEFPDVPAYRVELAGSYCNFANLQRDSGRISDSLTWYEKAINQLSEVIRENPSNASASSFLRNAHSGRAFAFHMLSNLDASLNDWNRTIELTEEPSELATYRASRAIVLVHLGQTDAAVDEVTDLASSDQWNAAYWYNFACVFSVASRQDVGKRQEHADRAMQLLQKSVDAGWRDAAHLKEDPDLEPLRDRSDFQELIEVLEKSDDSQSSPQQSLSINTLIDSHFSAIANPVRTSISALTWRTFFCD